MRATGSGRNMRQCAECGFWLLGASGPCANCGKRFPDLDPRSRLQDFLASMALGSLVGLGLFLLAGPFASGVPGWARAAVWLGGSAAGAFGAAALLLRVLRGTHVSSSLRELERDIRTNLLAIEQQRRQIEGLKRHAEAPMATGGGEAARLLAESERVLEAHRARYDGEMIKLRVLRWRNRLEPIFLGAGGHDPTTAAKRLRALGSAMSEGVAMLEALEHEGRGAGPEAGAPATISRLREDLRLCRLLFAGLLNRQVAETARGLSPLSAAGPGVDDYLLEEADRVASRLDPTLTVESFRESLEQLRYELDRMEAERTLAG